MACRECGTAIWTLCGRENATKLCSRARRTCAFPRIGSADVNPGSGRRVAPATRRRTGAGRGARGGSRGAGGVGQDLVEVGAGEAQVLAQERARHQAAGRPTAQPRLRHLQQVRRLGWGEQPRDRITRSFARWFARRRPRAVRHTGAARLPWCARQRRRTRSRRCRGRCRPSRAMRLGGLAGEPVRVDVLLGGQAVVGHQAALRSGTAPSLVGGVSARHWWRLAAVNSATVISGGCTHSCDQTHCARGTRRP